MQVNLQLRQTATPLVLNANQLGIEPGQRIEVLPIVNMAPSLNAGLPIDSACQASVEVIDNSTGRTGTYQTGGRRFELPAVQ